MLQILTDEAGSTFGVSMFQLGFTPGLLREAAAQTHDAIGEIIPADLEEFTELRWITMQRMPRRYPF